MTNNFLVQIRCLNCREEVVTVDISETNVDSDIKLDVVGPECSRIRCEKCNNEIYINDSRMTY